MASRHFRRGAGLAARWSGIPLCGCCHHILNVSVESKEHSRRVIEEIQGPGTVREDDTTDTSSRLDDSSREEARVLGGYKATLKSLFLFPKNVKNVADPTSLYLHIHPNVSDEAKQRAQHILEDDDAL